MQTDSKQILLLCPTRRLALSLQKAHQQKQLALGYTQWQPLNVKTLAAWLDEVMQHAYLTGDLPNHQTPKKQLSSLQERLIWQQVIATHFKHHAMSDLFDMKGLAALCIEANRYMIAWQLQVANIGDLSEETKAFLLWQTAFEKHCDGINRLEAVRYLDWQIECLKAGHGDLPAAITFVGFDQTAPQEVALRGVLSARGCQVNDMPIGLDMPGVAQHVIKQDLEDEMRTMVAWAKNAYTENPTIKLAMVVPQLQTLRNKIADLIDDVFQPEALRPSLVDAPRLYNFSLGLPLIQQPVIQLAINLIQCLIRRNFAQSDFSELLLSPYWSASEQEADHRALLDAKMREHLSQNLNWLQVMRFIHFSAEKLSLNQLIQHLDTTLALIAAAPKRQLPSLWAKAFTGWLEALNWSGERADSSHEYQAKEAWAKALTALADLDFMQEKLNANQACALLQQICQEQVFQPETIGEPPLQVLGIMEALSEPVDVLWVMGMNDDVWPMPARPNPLLPANVQREAHVTNADSAVQTAFAMNIHQRLMHSAPTIFFSSSERSGEKLLRASPLMQSMPVAKACFLPAETLAEMCSRDEAHTIESLEDSIGPKVAEGEHVRGGTGLIRAQAICPAWAFYQFRLGARALRLPKAGLDAAERGQLVHGALEAFWQHNGHFRHYADLIQMGDHAIAEAISNAVERSINDFKQQYRDVFSPNTLMLEHERISRLITDWLTYEKTREVNFKVTACEVEQKSMINGIEVTLKIDRVHALANGGLELVDYKTGRLPNMRSWVDDRITEPQLPIYAVLYDAGDQAVAGVQFGMVKTKGHQFNGVSALNFDEEIDKRKPDFIRDFTDWEHLKAHWKTAIEALVDEIKAGFAPVCFTSEVDMLYCEVLPLLRLPERVLQFEQSQVGGVNVEGVQDAS